MRSIFADMKDNVYTLVCKKCPCPDLQYTYNHPHDQLS